MTRPVAPARAVLSVLALAACGGALFCFAVPAHAGMPVVTLSDAARLRFSGISFFLVLILVTAWAVRALWNHLSDDFKLPRLNFKRALALVILLGLTFNIVLLMIAGTRELMTPGAWERSDSTYKLRDERRRE